MKLALVFIFAVTITEWQANSQNMREVAREHPGDVHNVLSTHFEPLTVEQLLAGSDCVVSGQIVKIQSHLNSESTQVVTDYTLVPSRVIKASITLTTRSTPGPTNNFIVRRPGGSVVDGDTKYSTVALEFPQSEDLLLGEQVVLFLSYDATSDTYSFVAGPFGAYREQSGVAVAMTRSAESRRSVPLGTMSAFADQLQRLTTRKD